MSRFVVPHVVALQPTGAPPAQTFSPEPPSNQVNALVSPDLLLTGTCHPDWQVPDLRTAPDRAVFPFILDRQAQGARQVIVVRWHP
jgi:hypothetical protein